MLQDKISGAMIRAICTDIDGTLLDSRRELSLKTIEVIQKISSLMPVILASSRMPSAMRHLQQALGILGHPLICYNGGYVIHFDANSRNKKIIFSTEIPLEICEAILKAAQKDFVHVSLYREDEWFAPGTDEWTAREAMITKVSPILEEGEKVLSLWRESGHGAHKVMIMGKAEAILSIESELREKFTEVIHIYHSKSTYLEIAPKIISKASALELLLRDLYNISMTDVLAFGDNYNDIDLLRSVGLGIAVGNARQEVKAVAKEITLDSKQDGVAHAIYNHLLAS
jgi:Cof subfamily protein (haloacid dehalogenase superfamily)